MHEHTTCAASAWTAERLTALSLVTDLPTTAAILRLPRSAAYELAKAGRFPVPLIRAGSRYRVPIPALIDVLHLGPAQGELTPTERQ